MRQIVLDQLKKCVWANLNNFDPATNTYHIPRYSKPKYELNRCYLVQLDKELINNVTTAVAVNFNNGRAPQTEYYKAFVSKQAGHMIYVDALEFNWETKTDGNAMWSGWLDTELLTQIAAL